MIHDNPGTISSVWAQRDEDMSFGGPAGVDYEKMHLASLSEALKAARRDTFQAQAQLREANLRADEYRKQRDAWELMCSAKEGILRAFRTQRPPSEATWKKLAKARKLLGITD